MAIIKVPGSTSNLGPGFDSHGLALDLALTIELEPAVAADGTFVFSGEGAAELQNSSEENLILRAMRFAAAKEEVELRPAHIRVTNQIPLARGLGSSAAAIIAGLSAFEVTTGTTLSEEKLLAYGTEIEGHSDNVSAALLGSFVVSCVTSERQVIAQRLAWPGEIRAVLIIPDFKVRTEAARAIVPESITVRDAVFNIQRASLLVAAIAERRFSFIGEAMRDRLHQPYRAPLVPGLDDALAISGIPGLAGVSLSGSGPTVVALATDNFERIAYELGLCFKHRGVEFRSMQLQIAGEGRRVIP